MADESEDFKWVMRLLAYHGARSAELCQLQKEDVTEAFGIPIIRIHDKFGSVKNVHSVRDVSLHPACTAFIAYAATSASPRIFQWSAWQGYAGRFQARASRLLRTKAAIADPKLTIHSLCHRWRTLAREINMPEAVSRAIMGHALGKGDHAEYGRVPSVKIRAEWMAKIDPLGG